MTTEVFDGVTYQIVGSSSTECNELNEACKGEIESGLAFPKRPTASILHKEQLEEERVKLEAKNKEEFQTNCGLFFKKVVSILPENMQKLAEVSPSGRIRVGDYSVGAEIEIHRAYSGWRYTGDKTLRIVVGDYGNKSIFKSKTQNISVMHTETALVSKVANALIERFNSVAIKTERQNNQKMSDDRARAAFNENKTVFESLGLSYYNLKESGPGRYYGSLNFGGSVEQWKQVAELIQSFKTK